jgi:hypothetical protein
MSASAVQFRGIENVVDAYKANRMAPFAILCGKTVIHTSEDLGNDDIDDGATQLRQFLSLMERGGSEAKYTLQVYKLREGEEIDSNTPYKRGFNFSLWAAGDLTPYQGRTYSQTQALQNRIDQLEAKLAETMTEDEEDEKWSIGKVLNGFMEMPEIREAIAMGALGLVSKVLPIKERPAKVAGNDGNQTGQMVSVLTAKQVEKANNAMHILACLDPDLGDNLMKIALIAQNDLAKYKLYTKML